jgi:hypothetical protein
MTTYSSRSMMSSSPDLQYIIISPSHYLPKSGFVASAGQQRTGPHMLDEILPRSGRSSGAAARGSAAASIVREPLPWRPMYNRSCARSLLSAACTSVRTRILLDAGRPGSQHPHALLRPTRFRAVVSCVYAWSCQCWSGLQVCG